MASLLHHLVTSAGHRPAAPFARETAPPYLTVEEAALTLGWTAAAVRDAIAHKLLATGPSLTTRVVLIPRDALWPPGAAEPWGPGSGESSH